MLKGRVRYAYQELVLGCFSGGAYRKIKNNWHPETCDALAELGRFCGENKNLHYTIGERPAISSKVTHKWVGAQCAADGSILAVPNDETRILRYDGETACLGKTGDGLFKWTGGCIWQGAMYCFPRTADAFLKLQNGQTEEIPLTFSYGREHHYGGVCTAAGVVYQPPRDTNHILKTDLKTGVSTKIHITNDVFRVPLRYCGSILHPNGFVYFFPESGRRVIKLDPKTDQWCFIGSKISTMCFDAKIGMDGNIYGYSAYCRGIMKIDVMRDTVQMVHTEIWAGAYGTKYGADGRLYSVAGDGSVIYRYDVLRDCCEPFLNLEDDAKAKYAGGTTARTGEIVCVPARENRLLILKPDRRTEIPELLYQAFFADNY